MGKIICYGKFCFSSDFLLPLLACLLGLATLSWYQSRRFICSNMENPDSSSSATLPPVTSSAAPPISSLSASMAEFAIPAPLKFLMSKLKSIASLQLSYENYAIWSLQIHKLFVANGLDGYLTGQQVCSSDLATNPEYKLWHLVDHNLVSALFSTISPSVLPYVLHLSTAHEIWIMLASKLQPTNRSQVIQLKNELHNIQMRDSTMTQYLAQVKTLVDNIAVAGSRVDSEDIVMYILNDLMAPYNPFKSSIRTSQLPISLETLYSLLCSEEINIQNELQKDAPPDNMAFYSAVGGITEGEAAPPTPEAEDQVLDSRTMLHVLRLTSNAHPNCQICAKNGHTAVTCWYRYSSPSSEPSHALLSKHQNNLTAELILDSGATNLP